LDESRAETLHRVGSGFVPGLARRDVPADLLGSERGHRDVAFFQKRALRAPVARERDARDDAVLSSREKREHAPRVLVVSRFA